VKALDVEWRRRVVDLLRMGLLERVPWPTNVEGRAYVLVCLCCMEQGFGVALDVTLAVALRSATCTSSCSSDSRRSSTTRATWT
jgi:hypothetical protein